MHSSIRKQINKWHGAIDNRHPLRVPSVGLEVFRPALGNSAVEPARFDENSRHPEPRRRKEIFPVAVMLAAHVWRAKR